MSNIVDYILNLKDNFTPAIQDATKHVQLLEGALDQAKSAVAGIGAALGIGFAVFEGLKFVKEGLEKVHELHKAEAALKNTMENMGTYSTEAFEKTVKAAKDLSSGILFSKVQVIELQSQLGLVGTIGEDEMKRLTAVSADMATKFGMGLSEAGNMLAKAVNNPEMARRLGMALKIDPAVMDHIKKLAKQGKEAEARMEILAIAEGKVGGAAKAAFDANPMARFGKVMNEMQVSVGGLAADLLETLAPTLITIAESMRDVMGVIKEVIEWTKKHSEAIKNVAIVVGVTTLALGAMLIPMYAGTIGYWALGVALNAYSIYQTIATAATWLFSAALWSTGIPAVVLAVAALTAGVIALAKHFGGFGNALSAVWDLIKAFGKGVGGVFFGVGEMIAGIFNPRLIAKGLSDIISSVKEAGIEMGNVWNNKDSQDAKKAKSLIPELVTGKPGAKGATGPVVASPKTKAEGQKTINIHVNYNAPLIQGFTISTTNIKEGLSNLKEKVSAILVDATHDIRTIADY